MAAEFVRDFLSSGTVMNTTQGKLLVGWGQRRWSEVVDETAPVNFYFPDFFLTEKKAWFTQEHHREMTIDEMLKELVDAAPPLNKQQFQWENTSWGVFSDLFIGLKAKIEKNELEKGVPYLFEKAPGTLSQSQLHTSLISMLTYSRKSPTHPYGFWEPRQGIIGATPEILFRRSGKNSRHLEVVACAGTTPAETHNDHFMDDPKMRYEHQLVIDGIVDALSPFGQLSIAPIRVLALPNLSHLFTPITLELDEDTDFDTIVRALHPTPALGASPRTAGMEWLRNCENRISRNRYGAPVGYVTETEACCYVAIRNVQWTAAETVIGAGCGVVGHSQFESEKDEINLKLKAIKEMLTL